MSKRRRFTDDFKLGDKVSVIRTEHGWFDGSLVGTITEIGDYHCIVTDKDGIGYYILKPRDIYKIR